MKAGKPTVVVVTNVYSPAIGGITTYVSGLVKVLRKRSYDVHVISYPMSLAVREDKITSRLAYRLMHELLVGAFTVAALCRILAIRLRGKTVIVHSQSASFCLGVAALARPLGARAIHTFHSPIDRCSLRLRVMLPFVSDVVCVSKENLQLYVKRCRLSESAPIIPGGVDCDLHSPAEPNQRDRAYLELAGPLGLPVRAGPIVLFVGRVTREKGVDVLLDAAKIVVAEDGPVTFLVVGPLDQSKAQKEYVQELRRRIDSKLPFYLVGSLRTTEDVKIAYQASDVMVCPSIWEEPSPMVVVEAMAFGLPVIASKAGGLTSRVLDGINGYSVATGDPRSLADAILSLLRDKEKLRRMGRESRRLAVDRYSLDAMVDSYEEMYRRITAS